MIHLRDSRWMNGATYLAVGVMYVLGAIGLPSWGLRLAAAGLCLAFGLLQARLLGRVDSDRRAAGYFALQAAVVVGLIALRSRISGAFGFLFFILAIQAALLLPERKAAGGILAFYALSGLSSYLAYGGSSLTGILFNLPVFIICGAVGYSLRATELARQRNETLLEELRAAQEQLQDLAVSEERNRLAREMHDALGHRLTVAVVQLEGAQRLIPLDPDRAGLMIAAMRNEMKDALAELRRTVAALRTPLEPDLPLEAAVPQLALAFQQNTGLPTHCSVARPFPALPDSYRLAFYRAAQEALTNVQRHAAARTIWLGLEATETEVCLTVEDDGRGFGDDGGPPPGSGLRGLSERAAMLGGRLNVAPRPSGGARVTFRAPLPAALHD